jgi:hypothetical protein
VRKHVSATFVFVLFTVYAVGQVQASPKAQPSQDAAPPATKLEAFLGKKGQMIIKDSYSLSPMVSRFGSVNMDVLLIYEPGSSIKTKGLRVEITERGDLERSNTSFIDVDELHGLSDALAYMIGLAQKWNGQSHSPYTEVIYTSKGELQTGFFQTGTKSNAFLRSGTIGSATAFFNTPDLTKIKAEVDEAIATLESK